MKLQLVISKRPSGAGTGKLRPVSRRLRVNVRFTKFRLNESQFRDRGFLTKVDAWVLERWGQGARTFRELVLGVPGVYPVEVLSSLRRLYFQDKITECDVLSVEFDAASLPPMHSRPVGWERRN